MTSLMTASLDLVKVTSLFLSKALTHFSPSVTTATKTASFVARNEVQMTPHIKNERNFGVTPWLRSGKGMQVTLGGWRRQGRPARRKACVYLLPFTHARAWIPRKQDRWLRRLLPWAALPGPRGRLERSAAARSAAGPQGAAGRSTVPLCGAHGAPELLPGLLSPLF